MREASRTGGCTERVRNDVGVGTQDPNESRWCNKEAPSQLVTSRLAALHSISKFKVVSRTTCSPQSPYTYLTTVDLWPVTGRMHQLRRHMLHMGTPILGDEKYFLDDGERAPSRAEPKMCLWALEVDFVHPFTGERVVVSIPEPDYYEQIRRSNSEGVYMTSKKQKIIK